MDEIEYGMWMEVWEVESVVWKLRLVLRIEMRGKGVVDEWEEIVLRTLYSEFSCD